MPQPRWSDRRSPGRECYLGHIHAGSCTNCHSTQVTGIRPQATTRKHYTTEGYFCAECHGTEADAGSQPGHKNGTRDLNFTNISSGGSITSGTCDVYCHSPNINDPKTDPTWGISSVGCTDCHSNPRSQPGTERHHIPA